jgi:hypothetical protein
MKIYKRGDESTLRYYPIYTMKPYKRTRKYEYVIYVMSNKKKDKLVFDEMKDSGFDVHHIRNEENFGRYSHTFGLNLSTTHVDYVLEFITPIHSDYYVIKTLTEELIINLGI